MDTTSTSANRVSFGSNIRRRSKHLPMASVISKDTFPDAFMDESEIQRIVAQVEHNWKFSWLAYEHVAALFVQRWLRFQEAKTNRVAKLVPPGLFEQRDWLWDAWSTSSVVRVFFPRRELRYSSFEIRIRGTVKYIICRLEFAASSIAASDSLVIQPSVIRAGVLLLQRQLQSKSQNRKHKIDHVDEESSPFSNFHREVSSKPHSLLTDRSDDGHS